MNAMTPSDRAAAEKYAAHLSREFHRNNELLYTAKAVGDSHAYRACTDRSRDLYAEIAEVNVALKNGNL